MPALVLEGSDSLWTDILKEEELKALIVHRMEDFWLTDVDVHGCATAAPPEPIVKNRGSFWGGRDGYRGGRRGGGYWHTLWLGHFVQMRDWEMKGPEVLRTVAHWHHGKVTRGLLYKCNRLQNLHKRPRTRVISRL